MPYVVHPGKLPTSKPGLVKTLVAPEAAIAKNAEMATGQNGLLTKRSQRFSKRIWEVLVCMEDLVIKHLEAGCFIAVELLHEARNSFYYIFCNMSNLELRLP